MMIMNRDSVDTELIKQAVTVASRAPSLHNSQPWLWIADGPELQLHLDRSRVIRHTDRGAREALISCGAVLDHLRIAMAAAGWQSFVDRFPNPNQPTHLASRTSVAPTRWRRPHATGPVRFCGGARIGCRCWHPPTGPFSSPCCVSSSTVTRYAST